MVVGLGLGWPLLGWLWGPWLVAGLGLGWRL